VTSAADARISVALCTHDGAAYVEAQVASILRQVPEPFEIVLGDDASRDDTVARVERLVAGHRSAGGRTELVVRRHDPALGVAANFADAIGHARGDLIALSDQDDVWHDGKLATLAAMFDDPAVLLVHSDARLVDGSGAPLGTRLLQTLRMSRAERAALMSPNALDALLHRNLVTGATVLLRRELRDVLPAGEGWIHDEWLAAHAAARGGSRLHPEALIDYRQHGGNQIGAQTLTASDVQRRLTQTRQEWAGTQVARWEALARAIEGDDRVTPARAAAIRARRDFLRARRDMPAARARRIPSILRHAVRGDYRRYAWGVRDVVRDLLQPHREPELG
jgi:hypothetical protein